MKMRKREFKRSGRQRIAFTAGTLLFTLLQTAAMAQDGSAGIEQANTQVRSYFDVGCNLMYAIGAVLGLVGAIKV